MSWPLFQAAGGVQAPTRCKHHSHRRPRRCLLTVEPLEERSLLAVGGGFTAAGILGEYFPNTSLLGNASFARQDVRIDFDWGANLLPGGSTDPKYAQVGPDNFSIRWSGQLIPAFSETYTFKTITDEGVRLFLKPSSSSTWTTVVDDWSSHTVKEDTGTFTMTRGTVYDVRMEYYERTGPAVARLRWSSPSTPEEVIEPLSGVAANAYTEGFADAMKSSLDEWTDIDNGQPVPRDANGWPLADAQLYVWDWGGDRAGTYRLQFNGKADLSDAFGLAQFTFLGYDAASNTSSYQAVITDPGNDAPQHFLLAFRNTQRTATSPLNSGVTHVQVMKPTTPGATTTYAANSTFTDDLREAYRRFTALRFMAGTNYNDSVTWSDRTRPGYSTQRYFRPDESGFEGNGMAWEYRVMLANETGKDLYLNIPEMANDDYVTKLAQLLQYGSDGVNPYTSPQVNPVFPPLNPNLKVYVELSNEVWNYSFSAWEQNYQAAQDAINNNTPDGQILTYDGNTDENVAWNRRHALRTVQISNLFRSVYGDANMGSRIRMLLEWQYDNAGFPPTAETQLNFLNDYFNNGDGLTHVANPHPVSYYLWGGGGATYYGASNAGGYLALVPNAGFEQPLLSDYQANPAGASWSFSGNAGIAHNGSSLRNPKAPEGTQVAYLQSDPGSNGQFQITVTFPARGTANVYGLEFKAFQRSRNHLQIAVYLDDIALSDQDGGSFQPGASWDTFSTRTITVTPGSTHTIKFVGLSSRGTQTAFLDDIKLASVDAIFASEIPADSKNNDDSISTTNYRLRTNVEVDWARLYGLQPVQYEGGWALGDDTGGSPVQNWAKFNDSRTRQVQHQALDIYYQAGGELTTLGTYPLWTKWSNAAQEPIPQGIDDANKLLRPAPTNGVTIPGTLTAANSNLNRYADNVTVSTSGWLNWNILVPATGTYRFTATTTAGGTAQLLVDDTIRVAAGTSGDPIAGVATLTPGLHVVRIQATDGSFAVSNITVSDDTSSAKRLGRQSTPEVSPRPINRPELDHGSKEMRMANVAGVSATSPDASLGLGTNAHDIGSLSLADSVDYDAAAGTYTIRGVGRDMRNTSEQIHLTSQSVSDPTMLSAGVTSVSDTASWAKTDDFSDNQCRNSIQASLLETCAFVRDNDQALEFEAWQI